jgi:hypothetical protein
MGLIYSGGTIQKTLVDGTVAANALADIQADLVTAGWTSSVIAGGYHLVSAATPQGLQFAIDLTLSGGVVYIDPQNIEGTVKCSTYQDATYKMTAIEISSRASYEMISNRYGFWLYIPGITSPETGFMQGAANGFACGVPYLPEPVVPLSVSGATNASPIEITTTAAHGKSTGDFVFIDGVLGNTGANGYFQITSTSTTTFTLNSSTGTGTYTSGGLVGDTYRVSRAFYVNTNTDYADFGSSPCGWRYTPAGTGTQGSNFVVINNAVYRGLDSDLQLVGTADGYPWRQSRLSIVEPYIMGSLSSGGTKQLQYQLYNACVVSGTPQVSLDATTTFDSHAWHCFGSNATQALMIAYT